jgi:ABC-type phosphate transport system substrate-binding protein
MRLHRSLERKAGVGLILTVLVAGLSAGAIKNMAVVASAGSKLSDVPLTDLTRLCKGTQKTWPDGKAFTLVIRDPGSPEMRIPAQKLFGFSGAEARTAITKLNETREVVRIVGSDDEVLRAVQNTPGAVGLINVYAINSSVKVLRIDGKLPFDVGYALKATQ